MSFKTDLEREFSGELRFDLLNRKIYSVDASIYEIEPIGIAIPKSVEDVQHAVSTCRQHGIPIIARGAATGIAGGCVGKGLILDTSKYLNRIVEINIEEMYAIVEPGLVQDDLNAALAPYSLRLGPETSTGNRATLGGMVANNAAGAHSPIWGKMVDCVMEIELVLADETVQRYDQHSTHPDLLKIHSNYAEEIKKHFPKLHRRVSGYNLDLLPNPCSIVVGSEGTLGIVTRMKLSLVPLLEETALCLMPFDTMQAAMEAVDPLLQLSPCAIELIDKDIIERGRQSPEFRKKLTWLEGSPRALLVAEFREKIPSLAGSWIIEKQEQSKVWALRQAGLELLLSKRSFQRALAFMEDIAIPTSELAPFMDAFLSYMERHKHHAGIYGHAGAGCLHIRPYIDLRKPDDLKLMKTIMCDVSDLLLQHGGAMSGEHGDGMVRSWLNKKMFGDTLYKAFCEVKRTFDPDNIMNPGKIVNAPDFLKNLRNDPESNLSKIETFQDFSKEGGFELAVDLCNGNGLCRKKEKTMCPSFQATGDEFDTTRARAQALRSIIWGRLQPSTLAHPDLVKVMDLCLECNGCKRECPSQIDMAKLKSEVLFHYQEKYGYSWRTRLFGHVHSLNRLNIFKLPPPKFFLNWLGIANRPLPKLAPQTFSRWWKKHPKKVYSKKAALFIDTFTEFNCPENGIAAVDLLEKLGYEVLIPERICCGRPFLSKGMLKQAKKQAEKLDKELDSYRKEKIPLIGLEPSCTTSCLTIEEFLLDHTDQITTSEPLLIHGHCHQKASDGMEATIKLLNRIEAKYSIIPSGCCGMAGSFGYEKEHAELSKQIGELILLPAIRNAPQKTLVVANGFSCRCQIELETSKSAQHIINVVKKIDSEF